jgi:hypothetical protein
LRTESCWRRAWFSSTRLRRDDTQAMNRSKRSLSIRSIQSCNRGLSVELIIPRPFVRWKTLKTLGNGVLARNRTRHARNSFTTEVDRSSRECMVRRRTARGKFGRGDKSAQMYSAFVEIYSPGHKTHPVSKYWKHGLRAKTRRCSFLNVPCHSSRRSSFDKDCKLLTQFAVDATILSHPSDALLGQRVKRERRRRQV